MGETIFYSQLAFEMDMPNARNLNYVLSCIGNTLIKLGKAHDLEIPSIQCLVVNKDTGMPGEGVDLFISGGDFRALNSKQKKVVVQSQLSLVCRTLGLQAKKSIGDSVDVMFSWRKQLVAVEVKSKISNTEDLIRASFYGCSQAATKRLCLSFSSVGSIKVD